MGAQHTDGCSRDGVKLGTAPLPDGRILVVGGATDSEGHKRLASTELVQPESPQPGPPHGQATRVEARPCGVEAPPRWASVLG
jgi:hypothetical protein